MPSVPALLRALGATIRPMNTAAASTVKPSVITSAVPRSLRNPRSSRSWYARFTAVIRFLMPLDAVHRARARPTITPRRRPDDDPSTIEDSWLWTRSRTSVGRRGQHVVDVAFDLGGVGHHAVGRHQRHEGRDQRQQAVEGHAGGEEGGVVGLHVGDRPPGHTEP